MNLRTTYLGLPLEHPIVASASPLSKDLNGIRHLAHSGASAIVLPSLFEEQIEHELNRLHHFLDLGSESTSEASNYFPEPVAELQILDRYLETISDAKRTVDVPIIASLNGATPGGWVKYAAMLEDAGADAIELNIYYLPTDPDVTGEQVENQYLKTIASAVHSVDIPVAVKIGPYFSSIPSFARKAAAVDIRGLVLFNRFYQPDIDLENLTTVPTLSLSRSDDLRLPLRWTAILSTFLEVDIAISSGVHNAKDVLKAMMAGASVTMLASELLRNGVGRISEILADMEQWMDENDYVSVYQMRGSMNNSRIDDGSSYERANYIEVLKSYTQAAV